MINFSVYPSHGNEAAFLSTLGIEPDPDKDWNERKRVYQVGERPYVSRRAAQTTRGHKDGLWTTVIAGAVMLC